MTYNVILIIPVPPCMLAFLKLWKNKLQVAQNKTVCFIKSMDPRTSIKQRELSSLRFLNVENREKQLRLNHTHKIFDNACPTYLKNNFIQIDEGPG